MALLSVGLAIVLGYAWLLFFYKRSWKRLASYTPRPHPGEAPVACSVIIAARNEEGVIHHLLTALGEQELTGVRAEFIVVNDHSTDGTAAAVSAFPAVRLLHLPAGMASKKSAIAFGIAQAGGELIITTDADCLPGKHWLQTLCSFYRASGARFIAAPVRYQSNDSLLAIFQTLDFITLQGITAAGVGAGVHSLCNGANLAYTKEAFVKVNGFAGIDELASGDDLLLMHKIRMQYPGGIAYLKAREAIVTTQPVPAWKDFFWQRIRWAGKTRHYDDKKLFYALLLVYLVNLLFPVLLAAGFFDPLYWFAALLYLFAKTFVEWNFLAPVTRFYQQQKLLRYFFFLQPLHIFYTVVIGLISQFAGYHWKGRKTK